uniref:Uncharacterized protein n=1 Tax=Hordeum vulgare subsp. vulgare TaxID=112509 RepID=A0A8I6YCU2_HORVV
MPKCTRCVGSVHFGKYCENTVDLAFGECFDEGFDENVGQQPVATDDENNGQQPVATDEDLDKVPTDDGQRPHDFDNDPNDDFKDDPKDPPNDDPSEDPNDDPSDAPYSEQPSIVVNSASSVVGSKKTPL